MQLDSSLGDSETQWQVRYYHLQAFQQLTGKRSDSAKPRLKTGKAEPALNCSSRISEEPFEITVRDVELALKAIEATR
jgi:hypothetical protein